MHKLTSTVDIPHNNFTCISMCLSVSKFVMKNAKQSLLSSRISTSSERRVPTLKSTSGIPVRTGVRAGRIGVGGGVGPGFHGVGVGRRGPGW